MWHEKVLAHVVESTLIVWEDLGSSPIYANFVWLFLLLIFKDMYEYVISIVRYCWFVSVTKWELA